MTKIKYIFYLIIVAGSMYFGYTYRDEIVAVYNTVTDKVSRQISPCSKPITYKIGKFDTRFNISKNNFLADIKKSSDIWSSTGSTTPLFEYSTDGEMTINLIYDYRQQATDQLKQFGVIIDNGHSSYDALRSEYNLMLGQYTIDKTKYESTVKYWNSKGGATPTVYNDLLQQKKALDARANILNSTITTLNSIAKSVNSNVQNFNQIGTGAGQEFDEGEFIQTATTSIINIYQYQNNTALIRVIEHELGHALGMEHVSDPQAIMYKINQGTSDALKPDDVAELNKICHSTQ